VLCCVVLCCVVLCCVVLCCVVLCCVVLCCFFWLSGLFYSLVSALEVEKSLKESFYQELSVLGGYMLDLRIDQSVNGFLVSGQHVENM
jgi:uncharacterized membrane protein